MRRDGGTSDSVSSVLEIEAHNIQASPASRQRPADLPDQKRLHISGHCPFPGSVHLSYSSAIAHLTLKDTARPVKMSYCKISDLPLARMLRSDCGTLTVESIPDFARN